MEPGDLRESPAGSGESDSGEWREVSPDGDSEVKANETKETSAETGTKDTCEEEDDSTKQRSVGEQLHSPYEEELDPRIQVWKDEIFFLTNIPSQIQLSDAPAFFWFGSLFYLD